MSIEYQSYRYELLWVLPHISCQHVLIYSEGQSRSTGKPSHLEVRTQGGLRKDTHVADIEGTRNVNKILQHIIRPNLQNKQL